MPNVWPEVVYRFNLQLLAIVVTISISSLSQRGPVFEILELKLKQKNKNKNDRYRMKN